MRLIGANDLPCSVPNHASTLYARNLFALLEPILNDGKVWLDDEDDLISGCLISKDGFICRADVLNSEKTN